ncbi:hypothetical protein [Alteromonas halophila]|uniref:Lipoprotein n=1 Tax=Alteromonas halophila TaxID=516698 RepID=A0A918JRP8_9ALTE|nr:hypothetical protein [Alteromonas halophila]GGW95877.1 hypothetical protein GCM10007391_32570 [Alteromonas halophila]
MNKWLSAVPVALLLTACGGGGSDNADQDNVSIPPDEDPTELVVFGDMSAVVGQSVEFAVATDTGSALDQIRWQSDSEAIRFLAGHTQVIGFDAPAAGDYPITVTATTHTGEQLERDIILTVTEGPAPAVNVRLGREATELGRVSLRAFTSAPDGSDVTDISWTQVEGPTVTNRVDDETPPRNNVYFQAPNVDRDQLVVFRATVTFTDGSTASDDALVMVNNAPYTTEGASAASDLNSDGIPETVTTRMLVANSDSPYADVLQDCVYSNTRIESCQFGNLPLLGTQTETPDIDDVLDRTLVSHPWIADTFREYLETSPAGDDIIRLLRANTAVVIAHDVRPSYYTAMTATIYLDAAYFWRTPQQRDTLDNAPDYRADFGNALQFESTYRYVRDGAYYFPRPTPSVYDRQSRSLDDVGAGLTRVLYHELAHANDYFDHTTWAGLSDSASPLSTFNARNGEINSGVLTDRDPLTSVQLHQLADVRYRGESANSDERTYTAEMVGNWFEQDSAVDYYSYSTEREDFAMLFERFMMLHRLGASADEGTFTVDTIESGEFLISYGHRNRIARPDVASRADFVVGSVLPALNVDAALAQFPEAQLLPVGAPWFDTVTLPSDENPDTPRIRLSEQQKQDMLDTVNREKSTHLHRGAARQ